MAVRLYERLGFVKDGIRKGYYTDPVEDAVLMTRRQEALKIQIEEENYVRYLFARNRRHDAAAEAVADCPDDQV